MFILIYTNVYILKQAGEKDNIDSEELKKMKMFKKELLTEIENVQVEYVTIR